MNYKRTKELCGALISEGLGLDLDDPNLKDTPERLAKMYHYDFISHEEPPILTTFPNDKFDEIIMLDNIPFTSLCSHHFLPFSGLAWFLYLPNLKLVGASKIARLIQYYSKRPQLQENLSIQIMDHFCEALSPRGAMLVMRAVHGCMSCRGVRTGMNAGMVTSVTRGVFRDKSETRAEALSLIQLSISDRR